MYAKVEEGGFEGLDEVGRERLLKACKEIHDLCRKMSPEEEAKQPLWRVQQIQNGRSERGDEVDAEAGDAVGLEVESRVDASLAAAATDAPTRAPTR